MSFLSAAKTILEADATLLATATGGIWSIDEAGRMGLNRTNTPSAFDSSGIIKPCVLLRARAMVPDFILRDDSNQYNSARQILECYFYQDNAYTSIVTMRDRVYVLLNMKQLTGTFLVSWAGHSGEQFDYDINACVERSEYLANLKLSV